MPSFFVAFLSVKTIKKSFAMTSYFTQNRTLWRGQSLSSPGVIAQGNMSSTRVPVAIPVDPCREGIGQSAQARSSASASNRPERPEPNASYGSKPLHPSKKSWSCRLMCAISDSCSLLVDRRKADHGTGFPPTATKLETQRIKLM